MSKNENSATAAKTYDIATVKNLGKSSVEITASIPADVWGKHRTRALKSINESITVDGFRKGMIPENILVAKVGDMAILEEMAEIAVSKAYVDIIMDQKIDAIGRPDVRVTKLASGNPLEFTATTAIVPEVKLPDYKKLAAAEMAATNPTDEKVTDKDVEDAILKIRKSRVSHEGHDHDKMTPEEHDKAVSDNLPALTDEFVKTLGKFTNVADFKNKVREMVAEEKKQTAGEKRRIRIADKIADAATVEIPDIMVESELNRSEAQFKSDIGRMGVSLEDYLKHAKKTTADLRTEWRPHAEKKAKLQLILNEIAKKENIVPSPAEIEAEVKHIVEHYKDADRERAAVYAETVLTNEKVFQFLEESK